MFTVRIASEEGDLLLILFRATLIAPGVLVRKQFRGRGQLLLKEQECREKASNFARKERKGKKRDEGGEARPFIGTAAIPNLLFSLLPAARTLPHQTITNSPLAPIQQQYNKKTPLLRPRTFAHIALITLNTKEID